MELVNDVLRLGRPAKEVDLADPQLPDLLNQMYVFMKRNNGIGLAATQVGLDLNMAVIQLKGGKLIQLINPKILSRSRLKLSSEGCLSLPGRLYVVPRYNSILITYRTLDKKNKFLEAKGLLAFAIQHEMDHLNGILIDLRSQHERNK